MLANSDLKVWKVSTEEETPHRLYAVERKVMLTLLVLFHKGAIYRAILFFDEHQKSS